MSVARSVCVYTDHSGWPRVFNGASFEFARILAEIEAADVVETYERASTRRHRVLQLLNRTSRFALRKPRPPRGTPVSLGRNYDVFLFVGSQLQSLSELASLRNWKSRTGYKIAFIVEIWESSLAGKQAYLETLREFDAIFTLHRSSVDRLQEMTGVKCFYLPTAVDVLLAAPKSMTASRPIDVLSLGRRHEGVHRALLELSSRQDKFYDFDTLRIKDAPVMDWEQHRMLTYGKIKRSKYFICFNHEAGGGYKKQQSRGEHVIPTRVFEGMAGGAVLIGAAPRCVEFSEAFGWDDAVVELPTEDEGLADFLSGLDAQPDRLRQARFRNVSGALQAHDWAHRWQTILSALGFEPKPQLQRRLNRIDALVEAISAERP